jgi:AraC-like DNA-binding protein
MAMRAIHTHRDASAGAAWEMARTRPPDALRGYVREYVGWWERSSHPVVRREVPTDLVPLIINFGSPVEIRDPAEGAVWHSYDSFTTGVYDRFVLVRTIGAAGGVQVNLTILGARLILGRPLGDMANLAVNLEDVFGRHTASLVDELQAAASWAQRFTVLDRELTQRMVAGRSLAPGLAWAAGQLVQTHGRVRIGTLVDGAGCSQRHLIAQFREQFGITPKTLARVLRFGRAVHDLGRVDFAQLALDCGYCDQAHFDRDFRAFAGVTPTELLEQRTPAGGYLVDE